MSDPIHSKKFSRRSLVAGIATIERVKAHDIPGFAGRPLRRPEIDRKFPGNSARRWPPEKTDAVLRSLRVLENTQDIGALVATPTV